PARRYPDRICTLESHALQAEETLGVVPVRKSDRVWRELAERVRERLAQFARRCEELEMIRAAAEVRVRRIAVERDQLREILAGLSDPVVAVDQFGEVVLANPSAEKLLDVKIDGDEHPALERLEHCEQLVSLLVETRRRRSTTQRSTEFAVNDDEGKQHWYRATCRT